MLALSLHTEPTYPVVKTARGRLRGLDDSVVYCFRGARPWYGCTAANAGIYLALDQNDERLVDDGLRIMAVKPDNELLSDPGGMACNFMNTAIPETPSSH